MKIFDMLAGQLTARWQQENNEPEAFPEVARTVLEHAQLHTRLDPIEVARWVLRTPDLPAQNDLAAAFGQPPVTVHQGERFLVDVYFWLEGVTVIHEHGFAGAFSVLRGASLHARYDFRLSEVRCGRLHLGELSPRSVEYLAPGSVRAIEPGRSMVHAVYHLEQPTVSIVARTSAPQVGPQFYHLPPGIAWAPNVAPGLRPAQLRRRQVLALLATIDHAEYQGSLQEVLDRADQDEVFDLLMAACVHFRGRARAFDALLQRVARREPALVRKLRMVIRHEARTNRVTRLRAALDDPELRFLLAVLLIATDRGVVEALVAARYPAADPSRWLAQRLRELAGQPAAVAFARGPERAQQPRVGAAPLESLLGSEAPEAVLDTLGGLVRQGVLTPLLVSPNETSR